MTQSGLDAFLLNTPKGIAGKKVGVLCHVASITSSYNHILEALTEKTFHDIAYYPENKT